VEGTECDGVSTEALDAVVMTGGARVLWWWLVWCGVGRVFEVLGRVSRQALPIRPAPSRSRSTVTVTNADKCS
jgi:hypothetical protein